MDTSTLPEPAAAHLGPSPPAPRATRPGWMAGVSAAYLLSQLILIAPGLGLGFDESVYVSQVSGGAPAAFFGAPRARGVSLLVAPVTLWASQVWVLRVYLAVLSSAALFTAFWLWRPLRGDRRLAVAAGLFASLWITQFYGPAAMPNLWVALGAVAAVGCFLRAAADPTDRSAHWVLGATVAVAALMRPSDALWLSAPMVLAVLLRPAWRRMWLALALLGGLAAGSAPWIVESWVRFGGPVARLRRSSQIEGGFGLHWAFIDQLKSQSGRLLCRPCTAGWNHPVTAAWLLVLPLLVVAVAVVAARAHWGASVWLPLACAATVAVPYLVLIDYAAPRFLLPTYALLAVPLADLLAETVHATAPAPRPATARAPRDAPAGRHAAAPARRPVVIAVLAACVAGHLAIQAGVAWHTARGAAAASGYRTRIVATLHRLGVRPPCLISGVLDAPIAFEAGCRSVDTSGNNVDTTTRAIASAREPAAVVLSAHARPPAYAARWRSELIHGHGGQPAVRVYFRAR